MIAGADATMRSMARGIDVPPREVVQWRQDIIDFRNVYVDYLNKTLSNREAPQRYLELRSQVLRKAAPAQAALNRIGAEVSWFPPPATGGPVLSGLINMVFLHEGAHGWGGTGMFGHGGQPYQTVLDIVDASIASIGEIELRIRQARRSPLYWGDRLLRTLLGIPAYLLSLIFQVPVSRIEDSAWGTALRIVSLVVEVGLLLLGLHEWFGWF